MGNTTRPSMSEKGRKDYKQRRAEKDEWFNRRHSVGRKMAELREQAGLTQLQLANILDVTSNTVSAIETGRNPVPFDRIEMFANALNVPTKDLALFLLYYWNPPLYAAIYGSNAEPELGPSRSERP